MHEGRPARPSPPLLHVRPRRGWLNDPNGVVRHGGRWHVFYQHNPHRAQHGDIAWAHVSSPDLVRWTEHPIAFAPQPGGPDRAGCWSGSALPWLDRPAVAYTGIVHGEQDSTVCVRTALDDELLTWSDPVVVAHEPRGAGVREMRDPFPFVWQGRRFALLGAAMADGGPALLLFSGDDPRAWRYEGVWLRPDEDLVARVAPADVWECPQLVRAGDSTVLVLSLLAERRTQDVVHLVGRLEQDRSTGLPRFVPRSGGRLDHGPDFYAPQVVEDGAADPLLLGWLREADAADDAPPDAVAGCLTLPRRLALRGDVVSVSPDPALAALVGPEVVTDAERLRELPERARVVLQGPGAALAALELVTADVRVPLGPAEGRCEVWLDGPVAEVFRPGSIAGTVRSTAGRPWRVEGDLSECVVTVGELLLG